MKTVLRPHGNRVLVRPIKKDDVTPGGIKLPQTALAGKSEWGEVVSVGIGRLLDNGQYVVPDLYEGEHVMLAVWGGTEIDHNGERLLVVNADEVLAVRGPHR